MKRMDTYFLDLRGTQKDSKMKLWNKVVQITIIIVVNICDHPPVILVNLLFLFIVDI
jgi:hypothetical protein